jgi:signal recognition particle receptor subunit beta
MVSTFKKNLKSKIIITGEPGSGKTLLSQAADTCVASPEIGVSVGKMKKRLDDTEYEMTLITWAVTDGRPKESTYLDQAHAAIVVCDTSRPETVAQTSKWAARILKFSGDIPIFFAANNIEKGSPDTIRQLRDVAQKFNSSLYPILGKDRETARDLLGLIAWELSENIVSPRIKRLVSV